ncbi:g3085 [Coccomyxa viridis]|uniref:G3085 protein n=1 Tax=Coccomyxa viridis TaxID=1274662 RepID=A0ABP1FU01_9CHLO
MIEMQGELERKGAIDPDQEFPVGQLRLSKTRADTVELTIGYHLLEGKMVDLKKPFAILEKQSTPVDVDAMEEDGVVQCNTEYKVVGVIRRKCLFKNRPRAIITKPEPAVRKQH